MILDTTFLGSIKDQNGNALSKARNLESTGRNLKIPTIVIYELFISVGKTDDTKYKIKDQRAYQRLQASKQILELTEPISKTAGILEGTHQRSDSKKDLGPGDAIVAATGIHYNEPVVTDDGDFDDVKGLQVENF